MCTCPLPGKHWRLELAHFSTCRSVSPPPSVDKLLEDTATNFCHRFPAAKHLQRPQPRSAGRWPRSPVCSRSCSSLGGGIFSSHDGTLTGESGPQPALVNNCCGERIAQRRVTRSAFHFVVLLEKQDEAVAVSGIGRGSLLLEAAGASYLRGGSVPTRLGELLGKQDRNLGGREGWGRYGPVLPGAGLTVH